MKSFAEISNNVNSKIGKIIGTDNWYLPTYTDDATWKKWHNNNLDLKRRYPSAEAFKQHCFRYFKTRLHQCTPSEENCTECLRDKSWG